MYLLSWVKQNHIWQFYVCFVKCTFYPKQSVLYNLYEARNVKPNKSPITKHVLLFQLFDSVTHKLKYMNKTKKNLWKGYIWNVNVWKGNDPQLWKNKQINSALKISFQNNRPILIYLISN